MLYGEKVRLRAVEEGDATAMQRWLNELDGLVSAYTVPHLRSKREVERSIEDEKADFQHMSVMTIDGRYIGILQIRDINWIHRHSELMLLIGEQDYRWRGFEEDAIRAALGYMFGVLNLYRIGVILVGENERARKVYEACGFKVEGRREDYYWVGDRYLDQVMLRLLASEYRRPSC